MRLLVLSVLLTSCASPARVEPQQPRGYQDRLAEAAEHDREAKIHERQAAEASARGSHLGVSCGHPVVATVADQSTSGGERVSSWVPCWSVEKDAARHHRAEADRLRREARIDRGVAANLLAVEREFCAVLTPDELTHTPFFHREDVASVEPYVEAGRTKGARVSFKPVEGLTADWMRQALLCHRARAAMIGYDPKYMDYDPTMLAAVNVAVTERDGAVMVLVRSDTELSSAVVLARARALIDHDRAASPPPAR